MGLKIGKGLKRVVRFYAILCAVLLTLFAVWLVFDLPFYFDRLCVRSENPIEAEYIVCLGNGVNNANLPYEGGWERIYTAVQLYLDGYGKKIVFTGGGGAALSEAEAYFQAAKWLGMAEGDGIYEPGSNATSDHPAGIQKIEGVKIGKDTPLNIVTSRLHSKRAALCFKKAGFTNFRLVTAYKATGKRVRGDVVVSREGVKPFLRGEMKSTVRQYQPSDKVYNDILFRAANRTRDFFTALRELAAMAVYKIKGYI
jgi:uncharacterized SAM-binding protein YcdF (DUF218 family)